MISGLPNLVPLGTVFAAGAYQLVGAPGIRYLVRLVAETQSRSMHPRPRRTIIFGAGEAGDQISSALLEDQLTDLDPMAFLDDDPTKRRLVLNGIHVVGNRTGIAAVVARFEADTLLLALPALRRTTSLCSPISVRVRVSTSRSSHLRMS